MSMRLVVLAVAFTFLVAGCLDAEEDPSTDAKGADGEEKELKELKITPAASLPEDISRTFEVVAALDFPLPVGQEEFCWMPSNGCVEETVAIPEDVPDIIMQVDVQWTYDHNNLGLLLYDGDTDIAWDTGPELEGTEASITYTFSKGGDYRIVIDPHWAAADTAELEVSFKWASD